MMAFEESFESSIEEYYRELDAQVSPEEAVYVTYQLNALKSRLAFASPLRRRVRLCPVCQRDYLRTNGDRIVCACNNFSLEVGQCLLLLLLLLLCSASRRCRRRHNRRSLPSDSVFWMRICHTRKLSSSSSTCLFCAANLIPFLHRQVLPALVL